MDSEISPWIVRSASTRLSDAQAHGEPTLTDATDAACRSLHRVMSRHLADAETRAVLTLGLTLAKSQWPFLADVHITVEGGLMGLAGAAHGQTEEAAYAASLSILVHTIRLLEVLGGDDAARATVDAAW